MSKARGSQQPKQSDSFSERSLASLIRALRSAEEEPLSCAECRVHFAALLHSSQQAAEALPEYAAVTAHLQSCSDCAAEYATLQTSMQAFAAGTLPELPQPYHFDLSFMTKSQPEASRSVAPLWIEAPGQEAPGQETSGRETLTAKLWSLADALHIRLDAGRAFFDRFPAPLVPVRVAGAMLRNELSDNPIELLVLPAADAAISFQLAVGPMIAGLTTVVVKLLETASAQPLADTLVTLRNHQRQLLVGSTSGQDGCVIFEQLPLGRYFIQVRFQQNAWEIPLVIMGTSPLS